MRHLARLLPQLPLALCALIAARQWARIRRAFSETVTPASAPLPDPAPRVAIILPVRDEAENIDGVLASLTAQEGVEFTITVLDDGSTDDTPRLLAAWAARDPRIRVHRIATLPTGWAGKAHAMHTGVKLSKGEWLLFTDADTRHAPACLRLMLGHALRTDADFLSALPELTYTGPGMRLLTPIGGITLLERATPAEVRDPLHPGAIATGQYILIRRSLYERVGGYAHPRLRATFADDVYLAEEAKRRGDKLELVSGRGLLTNEQWTTWGSAWRGWRKSAYGDLGHRPAYALLGGSVAIAYGLTPLLVFVRALLARDGARAIVAGGIVATQVAARRPFDRDAGLPWRWSLSAPLGWVALGVLVLDVALLALTRAGADWKGRPAPPRPR